MAGARFVTAHACCKDELFRSDYIRTNKAGGLKSLRCFPHCCRGHRTKTFCGTGVAVECDVPECTLVYSYFACNDYDHEKQRQNLSPYAHDSSAKEDAPITFAVGKRYRVADFESLVKTKDNLFGPIFPGARQRVPDASAAQFVINGDRQCWHYGWFSSRVGNKYTHCLKVFFFRPVAGTNEIECIETIRSNDFHIRSSRVVRKQTRLERRSVVNVPSPVDVDEDDVTCSSSSSERKVKEESSAKSSRKRDILCLLNPNSPRVTEKVARLQHVSPSAAIQGRALPPLLGLSSLVQRSNDVYFIVQVLSRVADFHTAGRESDEDNGRSLTLELPLSCPRITCGSPMEGVFSVLVAGVERAIARGFLAKLRDFVLRHPVDLLEAYSTFLRFFEDELVLMARELPTPCHTMNDLVEYVASTFAHELGEKYKELLPARTHATEPSVDALYLGKELVAALASSSTAPQWSPTLKNNAFSSLTGKWTRLSLQCRMQPQRHPSWLYRLLTDVASRTWSIDDRGDEMLILWPGSVGTSHIIHKLCGKHRYLGQSPYGLRSECTQLVGYLGKRNFRDNTVTLEYYYWPADEADSTSMRKRLTRHFRTHPDHPHLLEIHNVLEVCKCPDASDDPLTAVARLNYPGDWRLESSSMDTYERTP
ncbi:hypothetical protein SPRG_18859 [Saprolegnia parasitica CBS 223.65]|uniref:Uncharacterized protein n=1 Tax=Saprolegnia parasitica (strain CBS 223.65) TaxID=695850 RepID=A0A067CZ18_SAPPC|nr:hypothetical protein SPRG_18859 [Saprolegnia parasitica CBS 223.65]KDO35708.1 hypothetical protein SPRG_18859 [Saprolegnia parasitica CBS 223.65]|eukprot:XP_012194075.1 hypothetical protein SPRG_18859 [Saprolegnia parasitica CBS 223.65]